MFCLLFLGNLVAAEIDIITELSMDHLMSLHAKADTDLDGKASLADFVSLGQRMLVADAKHEDVLLDVEGHDTDPQDGKVSLRELVAHWDHGNDKKTKEQLAHDEKWKKQDQHMFKAADRDSDGFLEGEELRMFFFPVVDDAMLTAAAASALETQDGDLDGKLSVEEFELANGVDKYTDELEARLKFDTLDRDKNGYLDVQEMKPWESDLISFELRAMKLLEIADHDKDGILTLDEIQEHHPKVKASKHEPKITEFVQRSVESAQKSIEFAKKSIELAQQSTEL